MIADIHGNASALEAVLKKEADAERTVFLGDAVLAGPQPNETIALLETLSEGTCIAGNHDDEMLEPALFANFPPNWLAFYNWVVDTFDPAGYEFLKQLKPAGEYTEGDVQMFLHHGAIKGGPRHALPNSTDEDLLKLASGSKAPNVLFGHSHVQFTRTINGQLFINPGSVGQNRCGKQLACYGVFEDGVYRHCQVGYDQAPWLAAMDKVEPLKEFPDFLQWVKDGLVNGYGVGENEPWTTFAAQGYN